MPIALHKKPRACCTLGEMNPALERRREISSQYTYTHYTRPTACPPVLLTPKMTVPAKQNDFNAVIAKFEGTAIVKRPKFRVKEMRQELRDAKDRLQRVKNGYPLERIVKPCGTVYPVEEPEVVEFRTPRRKRVRRDKAAVYVYSDETFAKHSVAEIQNEFNIFRYQLNEDDRRRNNVMIGDINRRNRRRHYALAQEYQDVERYGMGTARMRAKRAAQMSALKEKREDEWWTDFIESLPQEMRIMHWVSVLGKPKTLDEITVRTLYREAATTRTDYLLFKELLERANGFGHFLPDYKLMLIFESVEKHLHRK